jgi:hypothetical protein
VPAAPAGGGVRGWGPDGLGTGAQARGSEGAEGVDVDYALRTIEDAVAVLRQASAPLGPMGAEWLKAKERLLDRPRQEDAG